MTDIKIEIIHYNRKGEEIDLSSVENKMYMKEIVKKVISKTLLE